ncbi:MAG: hypothetical protein FWC92_07280 [Defluviitaleaceae bacterium]|nr:hypothetical protein [Defluviitaleaceae bacterium]
MYTERLLKAINYNYPDEIPVSCNVLPAAWIHYGQELINLVKDYPDLIPNVPQLDNIIIPETYQLGTHVDEWGCEWSNVDLGMEAIVTSHPLPNREDIRSLKIPGNRDGRMPHGFMYLRLLDLRGFEEAMIDFAEECDELQMLIDKVTEYNCRQVEVILADKKQGDITWFGDDLGMQHGIAIGADKWRKYLKPAFSRIYAPIKAKGCYVYMHTDGYILDIMPDIVECGVDIINPQCGANGIENLARVCKGKIPLDLDLDRQFFPVATPSQIDDHVRECVETLYMPEGGLGLKTEINYEIPLKNIAAILDALRKYRVWK